MHAPAVREMAARQRSMRIPSDLVPRCPVCGREMTTNLRSDDTFVEDDGWHAAAARYADFLRRTATARTLFLDLGTGWNTPGIIKIPFWRMTLQRPSARCASINLDPAPDLPPDLPPDLASRTLHLSSDIAAALSTLRAAI